MTILECADTNAPYQVRIDEEGDEFEPTTWGIWDRYGSQVLGWLSQEEAQRWAACWTFCQRLTTAQLQDKIKQGRLPTH